MGDIEYAYKCSKCNKFTIFVNEENDKPNKVCEDCGSEDIIFYNKIDVEEAHKKYDPILNPQKPKIECPYCKSTNTKKIGAVKRSVSFGLLGFGSGKIGKQWHCNNCKSDF